MWITFMEKRNWVCPSWLYLAGVDFGQAGFDTTAGNEPIISSVKEFAGYRTHGFNHLAGFVHRLSSAFQT